MPLQVLPGLHAGADVGVGVRPGAAYELLPPYPPPQAPLVVHGNIALVAVCPEGQIHLIDARHFYPRDCRYIEYLQNDDHQIRIILMSVAMTVI